MTDELIFIIFWTIMSIVGVLQAWWVNRRKNRIEEYKVLIDQHLKLIRDYKNIMYKITELDDVNVVKELELDWELNCIDNSIIAVEDNMKTMRKKYNL